MIKAMIAGFLLSERQFYQFNYCYVYVSSNAYLGRLGGRPSDGASDAEELESLEQLQNGETQNHIVMMQVCAYNFAFVFCIDVLMYAYTYACLYVCMDGWMNGWMDRWMDE